MLLAAGEGTRLRPLTDNAPKAMVPVADVPMIDYSLAWMRANGVTGVAINLHYLGEQIERHVGTGSRFGLQVEYSREAQLLGSAGALNPLRSFFGDAEFIVVYGDVLTNQPLEPLVQRHHGARADLTMALTRADDPTRVGLVSANEAGMVTRFVEKPKREDVFSIWANAGIYVCSSTVWRWIPRHGRSDFGHDVIPAMLTSGARVAAVESEAPLVDIGSIQRLDHATRLAREGVFVLEKQPQC